MGLFLNSSWEWNWEVRGSPHWRAAYFSLVWLLLLLSRFSRVQLLCDSIDGRPLGSPVPGILQARTLEWVAISFSNTWKWKVKVKLLSRADSSRPHGLQPTRLLRPWDFPGKSTGVGCHCLLRLAWRKTWIAGGLAKDPLNSCDFLRAQIWNKEW